MLAARLNRFGGTASVTVLDVEKPAVAPGKVLVEVHAAGVNPWDWKLTKGGVNYPLPITVGGDFAGIVSEVGAGVTGFKKGDEVYGQASPFNGGSGSFAEFDLADAKATAFKPERFNFVEAGALPLAGVSALQALQDHIKLAKGQRILIHGGAGGIGTIAVQIAKYTGAFVATTVGTEDIDYVKSLGADVAIDYKKQRFEDLVSDYDAVFDTVAGETYQRSFAVLRKNGIMVSMLEKPDKELMAKYGVTAVGQGTRVSTERLNALRKLVDQGAVSVHVEKVFPLDSAAEALAYLERGHARGKIVVEIKG